MYGTTCTAAYATYYISTPCTCTCTSPLYSQELYTLRMRASSSPLISNYGLKSLIASVVRCSALNHSFYRMQLNQYLNTILIDILLGGRNRLCQVKMRSTHQSALVLIYYPPHILHFTFYIPPPSYKLKIS